MNDEGWWLWWPNDIRGPWGPKASRHLSYRWGKTPKKPHPENLSRLGIELGPAAWQARMLQPGPQRWTQCMSNHCITYRHNLNMNSMFQFLIFCGLCLKTSRTALDSLAVNIVAPSWHRYISKAVDFYCFQGASFHYTVTLHSRCTAHQIYPLGFLSLGYLKVEIFRGTEICY